MHIYEVVFRTARLNYYKFFCTVLYFKNLMAFFRLIHKVQCRCCNLFILCIHFHVVSYLCVKCTPHWIEKIGNFSMRGYLPLI